MTNKEAIELLTEVDEIATENGEDGDGFVALKIAIEALKHVTSDDLISRAEAIEAMGEEPPVWYDGEDEIAERNQWRADIEAIKSVPSADRPKGEWVSRSGCYGVAYCSECNYELRVNNTNFCPNCGAKMDGERSEE